MSTTKGNLALQLLDAARCDGDWDIIHERSLKVLKHAPGRRCILAKNQGWRYLTANVHGFLLGLALTAQTEVRLQKLLPPPPPDSSPSTIVSYIVSLDALQDPLEAELESCPQELPRLPSPATGGWSPVLTKEDLIQARVVIASICVLKGEWNDALRIIPHEREVEEWDGGGGGLKGDYFNIVRIKSLVLKGIALSHTNQKDLSLPLLLYRTATRLAPTLPVSQRDSPSLLLWTERALAHYAFAAYRCWLDNNAPDVPTPPVTTVPVTPRHAGSRPATARNTLIFSATPGIEEEEEVEENQVGVAIGKSLVDEGTVATAFRAFHTFISRFGQVSKPRPTTSKSTATRPGTGRPATGRPGTAKTNFATAQPGVEPKERERQEVYRHYYRFLSLLLLPPHHPQRPVPRSLPSGSSWDDKGSPVAVNGSPSGFGETAGAGPQLQEEFKIIELTYEGYLLKNLEFPEAVEYHEAIGEWVDLVTENWHTAGGSGDDAMFVVEILYRASEKTFLSPRILRHLFITLSAVGNLLEAEMALNTYLDLIQKGKERLAKGSIEVDFDTDKQILETVAEGIRFLCKHIQDGKKGMDLAEKCEEWMNEWHVNDAGVLSEIYKAIGIANMSWAFQSTGGGDREAILRAAEKAFKRGLRYNNKDADAWYELALAQAELKDIVSALEGVNKGLQALSHELVEDEYRRRAVPMLHLLALLMSATEEYDGARDACTRALDILEDHSNRLGIAEKESALQIQMTQLSLVEATEGLDVAMGMTEKLLNLYGRVFDGIPRRKLGLGDFGGLAVNGRTSTGQSSRPSTAQRITRLFTRNKREHSPLSPSRLPPVIEPPPSSHNVLRKASLRRQSTKRRPRSETQSPDTPLDTPPKIQVTDTNGGTSPAEMPREKRKTLRRNSVSGGTIRRMRSLGSRGSSLSPTRTGSKKNKKAPPSPQPAPMSSATTSRNPTSRNPTGVSTVSNHNGGSGEPNHSQLFHILKSKLHYSQPGEEGLQELASDSSTKSNGVLENAHIHTEGTGSRASEIPNNLPKSRLPHPISALGSTIADGSPRSISRHMTVPEPRLIAAEEKLKAMAILKSVWLFVAALYRRGGFFEDATMAIDEATALVEDRGEGRQDVLAERGFLALAQGKKSEATDLFESALFIDADYPPAIVGLSQILLDIPYPIPATQPPSQEPFQSHLIGRNRALALLQSLTSSPRGWNMPEAWFELSRAFEMEKDIKNAKSALWKVIELEDVRGVRSYGCVYPRII